MRLQTFLLGEINSNYAKGSFSLASLQLDLVSLSFARVCLAQASELVCDKGSLPVKLSMVAELRSLWLLCLFFACKHASSDQEQ